MDFDADRVRACYPALADGYAYLDGAAGTQLPDSVIEAMAGAYRAGLGNSGGAYPASRRSDVITAECRRAVADLTGGPPQGGLLGPNMTTLTYPLAPPPPPAPGPRGRGGVAPLRPHPKRGPLGAAAPPPRARGR